MSHAEQRMIADQEASIAYHQKTQNQVAIHEEDEGEVLVNGKLVYLDQNNKWIAHEDLTVIESKAFRKHIEQKH